MLYYSVHYKVDLQPAPAATGECQKKGKRINVNGPLFDVKKACAYLGGISRTTLYRWIEEDQLTVTKLGKRTFFTKQELDSFIRKNHTT